MKFVFIAVLLQLCLSVPDVSAGGGGGGGGGRGGLPGVEVNETQLHFGDLLVFNGSYHHYALYVDDENLDGKEPGQNIFEMTRVPAGCHFREFHGPFQKHNYLDPGIANATALQPQNKTDMIATIQRLMQDPVCRTYNVAKRNCEQIATKVRYGESHCVQEGASKTFQKLAKVLPSGSVRPREASAAA